MIPVPPAQVEAAPAPAIPSREVGFLGFNRFPLKGTVLGAANPGGALFAVLVADSGALDRDWHGPKLPGHGGRSMAEWLSEQGIGSFRFDKRMVGSRDPHLDTSLDAQAGDLKAAMALARSLPEAKGRRLLLVGHGEGALLSLVASMDADALLLLAPPGQSMAKTITLQITPQLPAEKAAANLAYLETTFQAIRKRESVPKPGPDVYPVFARFCASLMAPETLDFVRSTLDMDPWALISRIAAPMALAWGERDMQNWKPDTLPPTFRGAALQIPEANHLFKREPRTKGELDAASALQGYGDEVPLADLSPIAAWLKNLK